MSAASDIQICSNALSLLGSSTIASFDDGTTFSSMAGNLWPTVRDAVLGSHPWKCATKRTILSPESVAAGFDWANSFVLPPSCLRVLSIGKERDDDPEFELSDGRILTDEGAVYLRFVYQQTDITKYDPLLILAMTSGMAAALAYPVTKAQTVQEAMFKLHEFHLKRARAINGQQDTGQVSIDSPLIAVRGSSL